MADPTPDDHAAIRAVVDAYAAGVDDRRAGDVAALFTAEGRLATWMEPGATGPPRETTGPERIAERLGALARYPQTVHDVANHHATVTADEAHASTRCFAHHLEVADDGTAVDRVVAIRYDDHLRRVDGRWRIARREVHALWVERRPVDAGRPPVPR